MENLMEKTAELLQKELCSISLKDIEELKNEEITDDEFKGRAADAELFYKKYFEKIIKLLIQEQIEFVANQAANDIQLAFGRGTANGLYILDKWFKDQIAISQERFQKEEKPELGEL